MSDEKKEDGPDTNPLPVRDQIEQLSRAIYVGFEKLTARFDGVNAQLDAVEKRVDAIDKRLDAIDKRLDNLEIQHSKLGYKLDALNDSLLEIKGEFRVFEKRLYLLEQRPT